MKLLRCRQTHLLFCGRVFTKTHICPVIHCAQNVRVDLQKRLCSGGLRTFLTFSGGNHFRYLASTTSCGSDVGFCCGADDCHIPAKQFTWAPRNMCHSVRQHNTFTPVSISIACQFSLSVAWTGCANMAERIDVLFEIETPGTQGTLY